MATGTVTVTLSSGQSTANAPSIALKVLVLMGAVESGGASVIASSKAQGTLTPAASNSLLAWATGYNTGTGAFSSPAANNSFDVNFASDAFDGIADGHYTGTVTSGTGALCGTSNTGTAPGAFAAYEIRPSGGSTPLIDASSPASATLALNTGQSRRPRRSPTCRGRAGVRCGNSNNFSGVDTWTASDTLGGLTWTLRAQGTTTIQGQQGMVYTAIVPAAAPAITGSKSSIIRQAVKRASLW
jgi:hypothetical protein